MRMYNIKHSNHGCILKTSERQQESVTNNSPRGDRWAAPLAHLGTNHSTHKSTLQGRRPAKTVYGGSPETRSRARKPQGSGGPPIAVTKRGAIGMTNGRC